MSLLLAVLGGFAAGVALSWFFVLASLEHLEDQVVKARENAGTAANAAKHAHQTAADAKAHIDAVQLELEDAPWLRPPPDPDELEEHEWASPEYMRLMRRVDQDDEARLPRPMPEISSMNPAGERMDGRADDVEDERPRQAEALAQDEADELLEQEVDAA